MTRIFCSGLLLMAALLLPPARSQEPSAIQDPLLRVLVSKGILTSEEARTVAAAPSSEQRDQLAALLHSKGVISDAEYAALHPAPAKSEPVLVATTSPMAIPLPEPSTQRRQAPPPTPIVAPPAPAPPTVVPASAPLRVLPVGIPKREGIIPDIKLGGTGARVQPYGMVKSSAMYDSSDPGGNDMPLPGFLNDTGPNAAPEFHIKARFFRLGANFEWLDPSPKWVVTGKFEADFEGNFSRANNRNISTIRSSMFSIRLAWGRIDRLISDRTTAFALFGQDWAPFGSSTIPNLFETTGLGLGFGTLYERAPQIRFGVTHKFTKNFSLTPEFALVLPAFGNDPTNISDQLAYGERQGADSARPDVSGRIVAQFQLDKAPNVPPAQLIASFVQGSRTAIVPAANIPAAFKVAFPTGAQVSSGRYGYSGEFQLPTRWVTLLGKYYSGEDLRWYFVGELFSNFNDTGGLTGVVTAPSIDGASNVAFGFRNGVPVVAPQRAVRTRGGFGSLQLPLSRWFNANPTGRSAGWSATLLYTQDYAYARDVRRFAGGRAKSGIYMGNLIYKLNSIVTFEFEQSLYWTHTANNTADSVGGLSLFRGIPTRLWRDNRSEFGTIFAF